VKIEYMEEYIAVVDSLNFTATANKLLITQSALSRHIAVVEEHVGARLLYRDTHNVEVSPAGKLVYDEFQKMLNIYNSTRAKVERMGKKYTGAIRIGVPYYCLKYMDPLILAMKREYPDITIEMLSYQPTPAYHALLDYQIDMAMLFRHYYPSSEDVRFHDFAKEQQIIVASKDHAFALKESISFIDLNDQIIVLFRNNYYSDFVHSVLTRLGIHPKSIVYSDHIDTMPYSIMESRGVAVEPICVMNMNRSDLMMRPINV